MKSQEYEIPFHGGMIEVIWQWINNTLAEMIRKDKRIKEWVKKKKKSIKILNQNM